MSQKESEKKHEVKKQELPQQQQQQQLSQVQNLNFAPAPALPMRPLMKRSEARSEKSLAPQGGASASYSVQEEDVEDAAAIQNGK